MKNFPFAAIALLIFYDLSYSQNLLCDPGFEAAAPNPCWLPAHVGEAGNVVVANYANSGAKSLHVYTGAPLYDFLSWPYQSDLQCAAGAQFRGSAQLYTPPGFGWLANSFALVRVVFLDAEHCYLAHWDSSRYEEANPVYQEYAVTTGIAPPGTAFVRFSIVLEKQNAAPGQSVVEADDCALESVSAPLLNLHPKTLEFGATADTLLVRFENHGPATVAWTAQSQVNWLTALETAGAVASGTTYYLPVAADRSLLTAMQGQSMLHLTTDTGIETDIPVFITKLPEVPRGPSRVWTAGRQLIVQKRLPDGCVSEPFAFAMKGVCLSEAGIETENTPESRIAAARRWSKTDLALLQGMNANCIRVFLDFGFDSLAYTRILDHCYENDIFVVMTVDREHCDTANIRKVVTAYKNHPAILCWAIGNEWTINHFNDPITFPTILSAALATEQAAQLIHALDTAHPVCSVLGDLNIPGQSPNSDEIVNQICPSVDFWGLNVYPGYSFGNLFANWQNLSGKPMFVAEYGIDSYRTQFCPDSTDFRGFQDEASQALWNLALWSEIRGQLSAEDPTSVCLGGAMFEFLDEWWKVAPSQIHDHSGYNTYWNPGAFPDSHGNEEHFGIVSIEDNFRAPKSIFYALRAAFAELPPPVLMPVPLSVGFDSVSTPGGVILTVITDAAHPAYLWSTGDTAAAILATTAQEYVVTVTDEYGCTGVGSISIAVEAYETGLAPMGIRVFPNPAGLQAIIVIDDNFGSPVQMRMQNAKGGIVSEMVLQAGKIPLSLKNLPSGVYFLSFQNQTTYYTTSLTVR